MKNEKKLFGLSVQSALIIALITPLTCDPVLRQLLPTRDFRNTADSQSDRNRETPLITFDTTEGCRAYQANASYAQKDEKCEGIIVANVATRNRVTPLTLKIPFDDPEPFYHPDMDSTPPQIIRRRNYPAETHHVTTEDGFILEMHRMPNPGCPPVLVQHGFLSSSTTWILTPTESSLAYILWDLGYDVWLGNLRGNRYSKNHLFLDPEGPEFWDHSFHEMGYYDLPAEIDFILRWTRKQQLNYIGHSMGTTVFFVMASERPEYNCKIRQMHALAPVSYMSRVRSPLKILSIIMHNYHSKEFLPHTDFFKLFGAQYCRDGAPTQMLCKTFLYLINGFNHDKFNSTMLPIIMAHFPSGVSFKTAYHYGQEIMSGRFAKYDYGVKGNLEKYGSRWPPGYNVSQITCPVYMYYANNDYLTHPSNVQRLCRDVLGCKLAYKVPSRIFNHSDMTWAKDVKNLLYDKLIEILKSCDYY